MSNFYNKSPDGENTPNNFQDMDLGTPVSLESKIRFSGYVDQLLGPIIIGDLEINIDGSDGFECFLDDLRKVSIRTEESLDSQGDKQELDYYLSISEKIPGESNVSTYLNKHYVLDSYGKFTVSVQCDQICDEEMLEEDLIVVPINPNELTRDEARVTNSFEIVTEGEAQELIELIASIPIN